MHGDRGVGVPLGQLCQNTRQQGGPIPPLVAQVETTASGTDVIPGHGQLSGRLVGMSG